MITLTKKDLKNYPNLLVFTKHWKGESKTLSMTEWSKHPMIEEINKIRKARGEKNITFSVIKYREQQNRDNLTKYTSGQLLGFEYVKKKDPVKIYRERNVGSAVFKKELKTPESLLALKLSSMKWTEISW